VIVPGPLRTAQSGGNVDEEQPIKPTLVTPAAGQRGMTELHYAAYCNDPESVRVQLQLGVAVDVRDENGLTP